MLFSAAAPGAENEKARQQWLDVYLQIERADRLAGAGENARALADYQAACLRLEKLAADFPQWNAPMIAYRLDYCRLRLENLRRLSDDTIPNLGRHDLLRLLQEEQSRNLRLCAELDRLRATAGPPPETTQLPSPVQLTPQPPASEQSQAPDQRLALTTAQLDADRLARDNARLKDSLAEAMERTRKAETSELAWKKAAAGADRIRQTLAEVLLQRDTLAETARQAELDRQDRDAKIAVLTSQLADAEKRARTPMNHRAADPEFDPDAWRRKISALEQKVAPIIAREEENRRQEQVLTQLKTNAWAAENNEDPASAARYWALLADKRPEDPLTALRAAVWYGRLNDTHQTRAWADRFFERSFPDTDRLRLLAATMLAQGQWERSLALAAWAVAQTPDQADAWHTLGAVFVAVGLLTPGEAQLRHALDLNPQHAPSLAALAVLLAVSNPPRLTEAQTYYQQALAAGSAPEPALEKLFAPLAGEHTP